MLHLTVSKFSKPDLQQPETPKRWLEWVWIYEKDN